MAQVSEILVNNPWGTLKVQIGKQRFREWFPKIEVFNEFEITFHGFSRRKDVIVYSDVE